MYEAGISDHHKMIFSILRKAFAKGKPKTSFFCCYKSIIKTISMKLRTQFYDLTCHLENLLRYFSQC